MSSIVVENNTAQWHQMVLEAQQITKSPLNEDLESYLVFMLMRNISNASLQSKVMALEYIRSMRSSGSERELALRELGDQCLLYSGLFPQRVQRTQMKVKYYVDLGRTAYLQLAEDVSAGMAKLYQQLSESFVYVMDTLLAIRSMSEQASQTDMLMAFELWQDINSQHSFNVLQQSIPEHSIIQKLIRSNTKLH